ncbi:hypothetical protein BpHYR1_008161 [Brachionus plicatilis]|uniref:Uncharacterized protein n=1 Tax=Brachionus plicatilis TaxID=10195 RepID=A0A3M7PRD8_BRAPC|nr:hypothetical protein BpHYR1_008161 [Brachionus plicatilis]
MAKELANLSTDKWVSPANDLYNTQMTSNFFFDKNWMKKKFVIDFFLFPKPNDEFFLNTFKVLSITKDNVRNMPKLQLKTFSAHGPFTTLFRVSIQQLKIIKHILKLEIIKLKLNDLIHLFQRNYTSSSSSKSILNSFSSYPSSLFIVAGELPISIGTTFRLTELGLIGFTPGGHKDLRYFLLLVILTQTEYEKYENYNKQASNKEK